MASAGAAVVVVAVGAGTVDVDGLRELFAMTKAPGWALWLVQATAGASAG